MFPVVQIGPLAVPAPAILLIAGVWVGLSFSERYAARFGSDPNRLYSLVGVGLSVGVLAARLVYAARFPEAFAGSPWSVLTPRPVMLDGEAGLLAGGLSALVYGQRKQMPFWQTLDALTPTLMIFALALGLSHLASGDAFGAPTRLPWGIYLWGEVRHPTQGYEILAAVIIAAALWPRPKGAQRAPGVLFLTFVAFSAVAQVVMVAFRGDSLLILGGVRLAQAVAWLALALSLWQLGKRRAARSAPGKEDGARPSLD